MNNHIMNNLFIDARKYFPGKGKISAGGKTKGMPLAGPRYHEKERMDCPVREWESVRVELVFHR
ncbi:MAG TPA: hypothetical protein VIU45_00895 [Chitinophagaceae bacterium]